MRAKLDTSFEKLAAAAASNLVSGSDIVGLGSGSAVAFFAKALGNRVRKESLKISVVPSSMQSWLMAKENNLPLTEDSAHCPRSIDVAFDGADQISLSTRSMIKGGGGALLKEKIIIESAKRCFILADESKFVSQLARSVPVESTQFSVETVENKLTSELRALPELRKLEKGYPFFTESGNVILDCKFKDAISDPSSLESKINSIPGVVEVGIFNSKVEKFYKANHDGTFETY